MLLTKQGGNEQLDDKYISYYRIVLLNIIRLHS